MRSVIPQENSFDDQNYFQEVLVTLWKTFVKLESQTYCLKVWPPHAVKHLKNTKLYSIEFLRTEMTSDLSN